MYRKVKPLPLKSSASLLCNNLTVLNNVERGSLNYAVVHKYLINMVCTSTDGSQVTHKQVVCKEPSASQQGNSMIMQVILHALEMKMFNPLNPLPNNKFSDCISAFADKKINICSMTPYSWILNCLSRACV